MISINVYNLVSVWYIIKWSSQHLAHDLNTNVTQTMDSHSFCILKIITCIQLLYCCYYRQTTGMWCAAS